MVYDALGRQTHRTNSLNKVVDPIHSGAGDLLILKDEAGHATTWNYNEYGQVTDKRDHSGTEVLRYKYDVLGRLTNRWSLAKGDTYYGYDSMGNLKTVDYPNDTDLSLEYDVLDRLTNMVDAVGTTSYAYNAVGQLLSEAGPWNDDTVSYAYTNQMRSRFSVPVPFNTDWVLEYGYDLIGRLKTVGFSEGAYTYHYHDGLEGHNTPASLVQKLALPNSGYITNIFDDIARLTTTDLNDSGDNVLNHHTYLYNPAHQRTKQTRYDNSYVDYAYDDLGQLKMAEGYDAEKSLNRWHEQFGYAYDDAGNLLNRTNHALVRTFGVNALNQLTNATRNGKLTVAGSTTSAATNVTVNSETAFLYEDHSFAYTNCTLSDGNNVITAIAADADDRNASHTVDVYAPALVNYHYDDNGNLLSDGHRAFFWDDENQLSSVVVTNLWKSDFQYDGKMRRRLRHEFAWQNGQWHQTLEVRYIYDGNLVIQERHFDPRLNESYPREVVLFTRGLDLSGSAQGAGGIGGLLGRTSVLPTSDESSQAYYHADGNGNITAMVDTEELIVARYVYDPFGREISQSGSLARNNLYRFSSKELHDNSGLVYYLYRFYDPNLQRWVNRDPIWEAGFRVLGPNDEFLEYDSHSYAFVNNNPQEYFDPYGLKIDATDCKVFLDSCMLNISKQYGLSVVYGFGMGVVGCVIGLATSRVGGRTGGVLIGGGITVYGIYGAGKTIDAAMEQAEDCATMYDRCWKKAEANN